MSQNRKLSLHNRSEMIKRELVQKNEALLTEYREAKFKKMSTSPYAFFRGSNHLYWADFITTGDLAFMEGEKRH